MNFSHLEKVDMLEVYYVCQKNCLRALELYEQKFPNRRVPHRTIFKRLHRQLRNNESTFKTKRTKRFVCDEETETNVLAYFEINPGKSIRNLSNEINVSLASIQKILKKHKYHPYKYNLSQTLLPGDLQRRLEFCQLYVHYCRENPNNFKNILWSDEANFSNNGMFNRKNNHFWSRQNPLAVRTTNNQERFSLNVWCGMIASRIVGPHFYRGTLTAEVYLNFLMQILTDFTENVNLADLPNICFQQDGAPPHNSLIVSNSLINMFGDNWIGTHGPIPWPPRSPDLTPLDFYLWGYVKSKVYATSSRDIIELQNKIFDVITNIDGRTLLKAIRNIKKRAEKCIEVNGDIFEHLLK